MREILFRGKRVDNGEWLYGYFGIDDNKPLIAINRENGINGYFVYPETVGQFTGLNDKNGKRVFEGDVVAVPKSSFVKSPPYLSNGTIKGVIDFGRYKQSCCDKEETNLGYYIKWFSDNEAVRNMLRKDIMFWFSEHFNEIKVIGNIHDNPELLEVE